MWIFWFCIKILAAAIGFIVGWSGKKKYSVEETSHQGQTCFLHYRKHKGSIRGRSVGVEMEGPKFRLVRESTWDVRFKRWGLADEVQTGDQEFDDLVYVVSDNKELGSLLSRSEDLRNAIREILQVEFREVECDGKKLWISADGSQEASDSDYKKLFKLNEGLKELKDKGRPFYLEPFFFKAAVTEAALIALSAYAFIGFLEFSATRETLIMHFSQQVWMGLGLSLGLFVALVSLVRLFFAGSSRGHRVIMESILMLFFTMPIAGIVLVEDLNVGLDYGETIQVTAPVINVKSVRHKTKNGQYYTYHAYFGSPGPESVELPDEIAVSKTIYNTRQGKKRLQLDLGKGALGLPWVKSVMWAN